MRELITTLRDTVPAPILDVCKWERIAGEPHTVDLNVCTSEDATRNMGTSICTPGEWRDP